MSRVSPLSAVMTAVVLAALATPAGAQVPGAVPVQDPARAPGAGVPPPVAPAVIPLPLTAQEAEVLKDVETEWDRYIDSGETHHKRMRQVLLREYDGRTTELERRYAERIARTESDLAKRHKDTIALLEKFIAKHPNDPELTPDQMFRLADLYLDVADAELEVRLAAQEQSGQPPAEGTADLAADYGRSLALWEDILKRFPNYRQLPSTLYLLAYYGKTKDERRSLLLFLALSCANKYKFTDPPPVVPTRQEAIARSALKQLRDPYADCQAMPNAEAELVRHAWIRGVADHHFSITGELDEAIASYLKVSNGGNDSSLYAESLYKLAWSYYRRDYLSDSIRRFDESVKLYDSVIAGGGQPALELRDESIQYIAVAFTDPWEGESESDPVKAFTRAKEFYKGRENEPHVRDVWVAMGNAFQEIQAWDQSVDSFRLAIGPPWELNPGNPVVHQQIVNVFELKGDKFAADNAAAELAIRYAPGSPWYLANEKDREAMENQRRIAERGLYAATRNTHTAATQARKDYEAASKKDPVKKEEYLALYNKAVELYRTFISQYPESDYVYEFTYLQGEALYFSEHYLEAVEQYRWVRDHRDLSEQYFLDAAQSVLQSYEAEAARRVAAGELTALKVPTGDELRAMPQPLTPQPIPAIYLQLQSEWDNYQNIVPDPKSAPQQGINAALVSLAYLHLDDAIARFEKVMAKFCGNPEAVKAKDGLLSVYDATGQLEKFEDTNKKFIATKCGDATSIELAKSQNRSIDFRRARDLFAAKQYIPAAESFYKYYKTAPNGDPDLPTALYNAAVNYKLGDRPKTAIALFKEFTQSKEKSFRESPYFLDAKRLTALSYQSAFDYDNAIATYLELYDLAKKAKKLGIKPPEPLPGEAQLTLEQISLNSLYNAAFAAELNRDFKRAIDLYTRYEREETNRTSQDNAAWSVVNMYKSAGDADSLQKTGTAWRRKYGKDNSDRYIESFYNEAALWKRKGKTRQANDAGKATIDAWRARGAAKGGKGAKMAGEWELQFAENFYESDFVPYTIKKAAKTLDELNKQRKAAEAMAIKAQDHYLALDAYGIAEFSMAAKVRYGEIRYQYASKLSDAPLPVPVARNPDVIADFEETRDKNLQRYLVEAKAQWSEVVDLAKKGGISNRWSQQALENLGREFPAEFSVLRQEIVEGTEAP
jgi:cellulose synthase operon protein C